MLIEQLQTRRRLDEDRAAVGVADDRAAWLVAVGAAQVNRHPPCDKRAKKRARVVTRAGAAYRDASRLASGAVQSACSGGLRNGFQFVQPAIEFDHATPVV